MTSEAERIAAGLTEAQRVALLRAEADGHLGKYFVRWWHTNGRTLRALRKKELATAVWSGAMLTEQGLAVRSILTAQGESK